MDGQTGVYFTSILAHVVVVLRVLLLTRVSYGQDIADEFMLVTAPYNRTIYYFGSGSFIPTSVSISGEPLAIGYDPVESRVYWTERSNGISSAFLNGTGKRVLQTYNASSTFNTSLRSPPPLRHDLQIYNHLGLAVDHISRLVFYTDQANRLIATISITTLDHKLLVNTHLDEPRDLVLDIMNGVMFWTDAGFHKIERANYDGSDRRHIVNTSLIWPLCIALDVSNGIRVTFRENPDTDYSDTCTPPNHVDGFLYWADTMMQRLERCNLDGQDRKLLVEFTAYSILLGLAFDGENLFLVDSPAGFSKATGQNFIQRISTDGYNITEVFKDFHLLDDVYIWSSNNSQIGSNGCGNNNGGCSHMCLPLPGNTRKCTCPDGKNCSLENVTDTNSFNNNIVYLDDGRKEYSFFTLTLCL